MATKRSLLGVLRIASFIATALTALAAEALPRGVLPQSERDFRGLPYYRFYAAKDFDSSATSEFITTNRDGNLIYGDQNFIHLYDGARWNRIYRNSGLPNPKKVTILHWDDDGNIYAGGFNSIGLFQLDERNEYTYTPLADPNGQPLRAWGNFCLVKSTPDTVYFLGRRTFASYDKKTGAIDSHSFGTWITASFFYQGGFYVVTDSNEIFIYRNRGFILVPELTALIKKRDITISATAELPNGDIIMGAERRGLFRFNGVSLEPAFPSFKPVESRLLRDIKLTSDGRLVLAYLEGGIIVLDHDGEVIESFSSNIDFRFKSARRVMIDQSGTLWAMFNSSVAKVLLDSPLTTIDEHLRPSLFYASPHVWKGELYLRSFYVLYKAEYDADNRIKSFRNALPDSPYEIWSIAESRDGLYLNTSRDGIFLFDGAELTRLVDAPAYDRLHEIAADPSLIIGANSETIDLYKKRDGKLSLIQRAPNRGGFINRLDEDSKGNIWLEHGIGCVGRARIVDETLSLDLFTAENGLPSDQWVTIWMHEGVANFTYADQVVTLDESSQRFAYTPILEKPFAGEDLNIDRVFTDSEGNIWISANSENCILWKTGKDEYIKDDRSLSEMGEPYFEFLVFFKGGEAIIATALELFHFKPRPNAFALQNVVPETRIIGIYNLNTSQKYFAGSGYSSQPPPLRLSSKENSLTFSLSNPFSFSTKSPDFQYFLEGFDSEATLPLDTDPWSPSSAVSFTNLYHGNYTFMARARLGNGQITAWTRYPFSIQRAFYQTYLAYAIYAALGLALLFLAVQYNARRLKRQNAKLENMVAERTREIEGKNLELERQAEILESQNLELAHQSEEIQSNAAQLERALSQLQQAQEQLFAAARTAGRAEVATNVLHNVGNVLNSVNVSISNLSTMLANSRVAKLHRLAEMVTAHQADLQRFLESDEKGRHIPEYIEKLSKVLNEEISAFTNEVRHMETNVDHIKRIISTQQAHARHVGILQNFDLTELVEAAVTVTLGDYFLSSISVTRDFPSQLRLNSDKHKVLEILINLLKNAQESVSGSGRKDRRIHITIDQDDEDQVARVSISDNGGGISPESQAHLFTHGFTTREDGHGFGLHSCANTIKALGGAISITSPGLGKGATASITLPLEPAHAVS